MITRTVITPPTALRRWWPLIGSLIILSAVFGAYFPALQGEFIWDDDYNIIKSAPLRSLDGLRRIWFEPGSTQQFYPLTHTSFWLDFQLWGLHPFAYHAENLLLHALGSILVWRVLRRLDVAGAWLGGCLFALHPVCVESVAWITERKNTLSIGFFLASGLAAIQFWLPRAAVVNKRARTPGDLEISFGPWKFYWMALFLYLCALWSKTSTVGLPAVILLLVWWKRGRLVTRDVGLVLPFLAAGLSLALVTLSIEKKLVVIGAGVEQWELLPLERSLIAARALWFYLGKLCWPHPLMFIYPQWKLQAVSWPGYAAVAAGAGVLFLLWRRRNSWGRAGLAAIGYFIIMLSPVLGFFNGTFFRYSFVCDHFQYLAAIGPLAVAGAIITSSMRLITPNKPLLSLVFCGSLLVTLGASTWRQTRIYYNLETLWRDSVAQNPAAWMAHVNLANYLCQAGRFEEAESHYNKAIELHPRDHVPYYDLGLEHAMRGNLDQAAKYFEKTLDMSPSYAAAHYQLGNIWAQKGNLDAAIREYEKSLDLNPGWALAHFNLANILASKGKLEEAIQEYGKTSRADPEFGPAPFNLGNLLAKQGKLVEAAAAYSRAVELQPNNAANHAALGRVLAVTGHLDNAIDHYRRALEIQPNSTEALANLGNAFVAKGRFDEAEAYYRTALHSDPKSPVIHYNLAVALSKQGKSVEARAEFGAAKQLQASGSSNH